MAITKVKLSRVAHFDKDKNGAQLVSKTGKPYTRCLIDLADGRKASGFGNVTTRKWNAGDEVEIDLTQSGEYWNFSTPKTESAGGFTELDREKLRRIEGYLVNINDLVVRMYKASGIDQTPAYPDAPVDVWTEAEMGAEEMKTVRPDF